MNAWVRLEEILWPLRDSSDTKLFKQVLPQQFGYLRMVEATSRQAIEIYHALADLRGSTRHPLGIGLIRLI